MKKDCNSCANAKLFKGAYTGTCYIECGNVPDVSKMSKEELRDRALNPQKYKEKECIYKKGKPKDCGVTFDD